MLKRPYSMVKIKLLGTLRLRFTPWEKEIPLKDSLPLAELLALLEKEYPGLLAHLLEGKELKSGVVILVNGKNIHHLAGLETQISPGDTVVIFPPGAGG